MGEWSFPSGYIDRGEVLEHGAVRETKEETGLDVALTHLLGAWSTRGERVVFIAYVARAKNGPIVIGPECQDVRFFDPDALPPLAFPHDPSVVRAWRTHRR
jgi:ADP-ribose pyrophosphatase YjhB (NUDIX family)